MERSAERIRTTHTGSLPRPPELFEFMRARAAGAPYDARKYEDALKRHVAATVRRQVEAGIDVVNDGECSKPSFNHYLNERLAGFEGRVPPGGLPVPTGPVGAGGRDATQFPDYYENMLRHNPFAGVIRVAPQVCADDREVGGLPFLLHAAAEAPLDQVPLVGGDRVEAGSSAQDQPPRQRHPRAPMAMP